MTTPLVPDYPVKKPRFAKIRQLGRLAFKLWAFKSIGMVAKMIVIIRLLRRRRERLRRQGFIPEENY